MSEYRYFHIHWRSLARAVVAAGGEVTVLTSLAEADRGAARVCGKKATLCLDSRFRGNDDEGGHDDGMTFIQVNFSRGIRPFGDLWLMLRLWRLLRGLRPDVAQNISLKAALLGGFPAWLAGAPRIVNAVPGFGRLFPAAGPGRLLRALSPVLRFLFTRPPCVAVAQNRRDYDYLRALTRGRAQVALIRGVGVDTNRYRPTPEPDGDSRLVLLPARLLWSKGVGEFVAAARELKTREPRIRMVLAGKLDAANPDAVAAADMERWTREGAVEYWGEREDMEAVYRAAHIVCLPTAYGEGLPTALLEAAAAGRAVIAGDVPGCREAIADGVNGVIVPPRDPAALARAILDLARDGAKRERYRRKAREAVVEHFADTRINGEYLALYGQARRHA